MTIVLASTSSILASNSNQEADSITILDMTISHRFTKAAPTHREAITLMPKTEAADTLRAKTTTAEASVIEMISITSHTLDKVLPRHRKIVVM